MAQEQVWDKEYRNSKLLTKDNKPQTDVVRFAKFLKKEQKFDIENKKVLDLGSGAGRNSLYFAELGALVTGIEISKTAIDIAKSYMSKGPFDINFVKQSMGEKFPVDDCGIDIVLDVTSSNSLNEVEREVHISEVSRVLKQDGYFFVKALCKDGDDNAKFLLKNHPGPEKDTYVMPELGVTERVWSKEDFMEYYGKYFNVVHMEKKTTYSRMNSRVYKRNFWICYLKKSI